MSRGPSGEGSVYQRASDGAWVATVFLGYHPGTGRRMRKAFYAPTQREALKKRKDFLSELERGAPPETSARKAHTVGSWLDYWLDEIVAPGREPTTHSSYEVLIRVHLKPYLGAVPLRELDVERLRRWQKQLRDRDVGTRTQQSALTRLRTALNVAVAERKIVFNPALHLEMPRGGRAHKPDKPNLADAQRLLDAARGNRLEAVVTVGLSLGLRRGEVLGLRWQDIDFEGRTLTVTQRVSTLRGRAFVRQGRKMRPEDPLVVALPDVAVQALRAHRGRQLAERLRAGTRWRGPEPTVDGQPSGLVFTSTVGTVLDPNNVLRTFEEMRHRAGLDDKTFHHLRHDCASLLLAQGVSMYVVSQVLGHSSPSITARFYAHLTAELERGAASATDRMLGPLMRG